LINRRAAAKSRTELIYFQHLPAFQLQFHTPLIASCCTQKWTGRGASFVRDLLSASWPANGSAPAVVPQDQHLDIPATGYMLIGTGITNWKEIAMGLWWEATGPKSFGSGPGFQVKWRKSSRA